MNIALFEDPRARRYLLGQASEDECAALEERYLADEDAVARMMAAEDELIEDYLQDRLNAVERGQFERSYLSTPQHRVRVETVRRLLAGAASASASAGLPAAAQPTRAPAEPRTSARTPRRWMPWLALAASVVVAGGAFWLWSGSGDRRSEPSNIQAAAPSAPAEATTNPDRVSARVPRLLAVTLLPVAVRSATDADATVVPPDVDELTIRLELDRDTRRLVPARATIRTVTGAPAWEGLAAPVRDSATAAASLAVPAAALPSDDYFVTVFGRDPQGREQEWAQYVLRIRR